MEKLRSLGKGTPLTRVRGLWLRSSKHELAVRLQRVEQDGDGVALLARSPAGTGRA